MIEKRWRWLSFACQIRFPRSGWLANIMGWVGSQSLREGRPVKGEAEETSIVGRNDESSNFTPLHFTSSRKRSDITLLGNSDLEYSPDLVYKRSMQRLTTILTL